MTQERENAVNDILYFLAERKIEPYSNLAIIRFKDENDADELVRLFIV